VLGFTGFYQSSGFYSNIEATRGAYRVLVGRPEIRDHLEDLGIDGRIILKWVQGRALGKHGIDFSGLGEREVVGACGCDDEHSGSIKCGKFLD